MLSQIRPAIVSMVLFTLLLGLAYPLGVTGLAQTLLPAQANGSLLRADDGRVVGSSLVGQTFNGPGYLHPRPSAAGDGYDASASSGSNLGPMDSRLTDRIAETAAGLRADSPAPIPGDAITASASGLDPHISPANAERQAPRIAAARGLALAQVRAAIARETNGPLLGFIGRPTVNVLRVNLALDAEDERAQRPAR